MHRDIKPDNILASASPLCAVIIDFGCATWERTSTDHEKGTIRYLAPEVIALKAKNPPRNLTYNMSADVWGMGLTAWELFRGSRARFERITKQIYDEELLSSLEKVSKGTDNNPQWAFGLAKEMLRWEPKLRITSEQALQKCPTFIAEKEKRKLQPGKREHGGMY